VLVSAFVSQRIGIAAIFGAFIFGLIMPRYEGLTEAVRGRFEDFVVIVLLPLFFVVTGLKTQVGSLNRLSLWGFALLLFAVALTGKWLGAMLAARYGGFSWRDSSAIGALMNTRGLTELIVLNIGLDLGIVSPALFTMLVVMALVTTFMAGPALRLIDPKRELSEPPEEELREARVAEKEEPVAVPSRSILVAPQDTKNLESLLALAVPLAKSTPPRELILAEVVVPTRFVTGALYDERDVNEANARLVERRRQLEAEGVAARTAAFTSVSPGSDYVRLASQQEVDLVMLDGRRPLLGEGVPRGPVGEVLEKAPCDVGILVERQTLPELDAEHPIYVPFGGAEHDWAALELAAWIASVRDAPLRMLGAATAPGEDASPILADASLVVQQLAGIPVEPRVVDLSNGGMIQATAGAGLLVVGLSERWREEGLGEVRSTIAKRAEVPILFVRRGTRPGALTPREADAKVFSWSRAAGSAPVAR
jgi:hypothetical protein